MLNNHLLGAALNAKASTGILLEPCFDSELTRDQKKLVLNAVSELSVLIESLTNKPEPIKIESTGKRPSDEEIEKAAATFQASVFNKPDRMVAIKRSNEHLPIGSKMACPVCNVKITKARYNTNFCSNKGAGNCKDAFYQATQGDRHKKG
ncbi:hypothetical protein [Vibrio phage vB_VneS_J26]